MGKPPQTYIKGKQAAKIVLSAKSPFGNSRMSVSA
jgi:hypothetical protein